ncbi:protein of unknown function [Methanoculleus bourgensis]|uniref:Uncharacterized protein n=1 Tax=Methanoculleus bourgensis TaxID=83986 RepID=A0A0X3BIY9_9EURY|nr:protein of unknown function [Methanoculleus bourgensis]
MAQASQAVYPLPTVILPPARIDKPAGELDFYGSERRSIASSNPNVDENSWYIMQQSGLYS